MADADSTSLFSELKSGTKTSPLENTVCTMPQPKEESANTTVISPLFKIPLELRIEIYRYLLRSPRVICVRNSPHVRNDPPYDFVSVRVVHCEPAEDAMLSQWRTKLSASRGARSGKPLKKKIESAILLVNRQTSSEARCILYSENSFAFHVVDSLVIPNPDFTPKPSLAEKHQHQYQTSKISIILAQGPKSNHVEILSARGSPSCPEPSSFFETQPRDFRFMRTLIFGFKMVPRIRPSQEDAGREDIFIDQCHYISRHLQLFNLTLIANSGRFAHEPAEDYEDPRSKQFLEKVSLMEWVQCLVPIVANL